MSIELHDRKQMFAVSKMQEHIHELELAKLVKSQSSWIRFGNAVKTHLYDLTVASIP
jgi:hypothetical protein